MNVILLLKTSMLEFHKGAFWALYFSYSMSMTLSVVQKRQLNSYCLRTIQTYLYMLQHLKNYTAKANKVLRQLKSYIDANYLHINLKKSKCIHFRSNRQNTISNTVYYDICQLEQVPNIKFLGIIISETLVWNDHVKSVTRKLSKITGSLYKIRRCISKAMLRNVYYALVNSQLMYGISIWGSGGSMSNLLYPRCLFSAQKKCIRSLFRVKRIGIMCPGHTKSSFTTYKILTVHNL